MSELQKESTENDNFLDLKKTIEESIDRMSETITNIREKVDAVLSIDPERAAFNLSLLRSMAAQIEGWETNKPFDLRISQLRGLHKLVAFLERGGNEHNTGYFRQPTGAGKTVLYSLVAFLLNRKTVIFVPKNNLLDQTKKEMIGLGIPEDSIGIIGGGKKEIGKQFLIATYASHNSKMATDSEYSNDLSEREVVICDEAHTSLGAVTRKSLDSISDGGMGNKNDDEPEMTAEEEVAEEKFFETMEKDFQEKRKNVLTLGFTATTELGKKSVGDYFHELIADEKYAELVAAGILVPLKVITTTPVDIYEDELDYIAEKDEGKIMQRGKVYDKLNKELVDLKKRAEEPIFPIAFCSTILECDAYTASAKKYGLKCDIVTSREDKDALQNAERKLLAGEIDCIITVGKLTEGWNLPPVNCAIIARASQSPARIVQGVGRTSRSFSGSRYEGYELHKPLKKTCSFVLEPEWQRRMRPAGESKEREKTGVSGKEKSKGTEYYASAGRTPLGIAEALSLSGEEPEGIVSREDGKDISFSIEVDISELYLGRKITTTKKFLKDIPKGNDRNFFKIMTTNKIKAIPHLRYKNAHVYYEDDLERILAMPEVEVVKEETYLTADAAGNIEIDTEDGPRTAMTSMAAAIEIFGEKKSNMRGFMKRYGFDKISYSINNHTIGGKTNAFWKADVQEVKIKYQAEIDEKNALESAVQPNKEGMLRHNFGSGEKTYWTDSGFENQYNLPTGICNAIARAFKPTSVELQVNGKKVTLYEEEFLKQFLSVIVDNNSIINIPDIRSPEKKLRQGMSMSSFAKSKFLSFSSVHADIMKKNIKPAYSNQVVREDATSTMLQIKLSFGNRVNLIRVEDPVHGTYYVNSRNNINEMVQGITSNKGEGQVIYWLDELEEAMKDCK